MDCPDEMMIVIEHQKWEGLLDIQNQIICLNYRSDLCPSFKLLNPQKLPDNCFDRILFALQIVLWRLWFLRCLLLLGRICLSPLLRGSLLLSDRHLLFGLLLRLMLAFFLFALFALRFFSHRCLFLNCRRCFLLLRRLSDCLRRRFLLGRRGLFWSWRFFLGRGLLLRWHDLYI